MTSSGSMYDTWLIARIVPPLSGTFSMPRQVRRNSAEVGGMEISQPHHSQKPSLGCLRRTSASSLGGSAPGYRQSALGRAWEDGGTMRWSVVIPVKRLPLAKSRLYDGTRPREVHRELALALALDTALAYGASRATALAPGDGVAVLSADLAALRPDELGAALAASTPHRRAFVADAAGTGTTLLAARPGVALEPRYGGRSRAAHRASGAAELAGDWPSLRRDVDTAEDLAAAARLGLGPATAAALGRVP